MNERRALQIAVAAAAVIAVLAGMDGLLGLSGRLHDPGANTSFAGMQLRGSAILTAIGVGYASIAPRIERYGLPFGVLSMLLMLFALVRFMELSLIGGRAAATLQAALVAELIAAPVLALWQMRVARRFP